MSDEIQKSKRKRGPAKLEWKVKAHDGSIWVLRWVREDRSLEMRQFRKHFDSARRISGKALLTLALSVSSAKGQKLVDP